MGQFNQNWLMIHLCLICIRLNVLGSSYRSEPRRLENSAHGTTITVKTQHTKLIVVAVDHFLRWWVELHLFWALNEQNSMVPLHGLSDLPLHGLADLHLHGLDELPLRPVPSKLRPYVGVSVWTYPTLWATTLIYTNETAPSHISIWKEDVS